MKSRAVIRTLQENASSLIVPRTEAEYDEAVILLNVLVDEVGDNPTDPRYRLIETLSTLVEAYDNEHHQMTDVSGIEVLRFLMQQHNLTQTDLKEDLGGQSVAPEVLSGKRDLNLGQIKALARRFSVSPAVFI